MRKLIRILSNRRRARAATTRRPRPESQARVFSLLLPPTFPVDRR